MRIGSSSYSFKRLDFDNPSESQMKLLDIFPLAYQFGLDGLELLAVQFESTDDDYIYKMKKLAIEHSLDIYAISVHNNFVTPDENKRREEIEKVKVWIKIASKLGASIVRVFGGRWGTITDFKELMAMEGKEPPLEGYSYEQGIEWNVQAFKECLKTAKEYGIILAIENHWGLTYSAEGVLQILNGVNDEWFRVILDCGNFRENTYEQLEALMPYTVMVHAKTYFGGGIFYDYGLNPDYIRIIKALKKHNFKGYLSIEFEGKAPYDEGILASIQLLKNAIMTS